MHTFIHSCGSISLLMPDMIEAGIEIFNPVQTKAWRMEPRFLKKEFGKDCTFWGGGIETVGTLNNGTRHRFANRFWNAWKFSLKAGDLFLIPFTTYFRMFRLKILLPCMML